MIAVWLCNTVNADKWAACKQVALNVSCDHFVVLLRWLLCLVQGSSYADGNDIFFKSTGQIPDCLTTILMTGGCKNVTRLRLLDVEAWSAFAKKSI